MRPNFLIFCVDQMQAYCMSCSGHPDVQTPNLDRLAQRWGFVSPQLLLASGVSAVAGFFDYWIDAFATRVDTKWHEFV